MTVTAAPDRYAAMRALYGAATFAAIQSSRVLVVGAGGIGCELLKNLALSGFLRIDVIDLDSIDVSNLNRQFLFRRAHVGQSKAVVAREAVLAMNSQPVIHAHHDNVKSSQYDKDYFASFTLVMNALDNIEARRHVNRLCISANIPLIESGTQGYSGQVFPILPNVSECYECNTVSAPKTYAVCTIRHTPEKDVHCIVWAKYLYNALFGEQDEENVMNDMRVYALDNAGVSGSIHDRAHQFTRRLLAHLFTSAIQQQLENKETWTLRLAPIPLTFDDSDANISQWNDSSYLRSHDQSVLSVLDTVAMFEASIVRLLSERSSLLGSLSFDKDDDVAMDIVTALANLRMRNFHIAPQSRFAIKGIAGNIVHAVATTNAIAAGIQTCEAIRLIAKNAASVDTTSLQQVYITPYRPHLLQSQPLEPPKSHCYICGDQPVQLIVDTNTFSLRKLFADVCVKGLSFVEPAIDIYSTNNAIGTLDDCEPEYLDRTLAAIQCVNGTRMRVEDEAQSLIVTIEVRHAALEDTSTGFELRGSKGATALTVSPSEAKTTQTSSVAAVGDGADDELEIIDGSSHAQKSQTRDRQANGARKRPHSPVMESNKRFKLAKDVDGKDGVEVIDE